MFNLRVLGVLAASLAVIATGGARAEECPGKPDALGTSRTLVVEPTEHIRLGMMQYPETLPLDDHEVVLTFDDGPLPPYTTRALDILASECVKATFFLVGRMAKAYPNTVRQIHTAGHSIGTHSNSHPFTFHRMTQQQADAEIEGGIEAVSAALGDRNAVAPFFRIPGLLRSDAIERYLANRSLMTWSADFPADDWLRISAKEIAKRALRADSGQGARHAAPARHQAGDRAGASYHPWGTEEPRLPHRPCRGGDAGTRQDGDAALAMVGFEESHAQTSAETSPE